MNEDDTSTRDNPPIHYTSGAQVIVIIYIILCLSKYQVLPHLTVVSSCVALKVFTLKQSRFSFNRLVARGVL